MATPDALSSLLFRPSSSDPEIPHQKPNPNPNPNPNPKTRTLTLTPSSAPTRYSALTEDRQGDHNRRQSVSSPSPYYRGFTDFALHFRSLGFISGRNSLASSAFARSTASSSSASVLHMIQEWAPSFFLKSYSKKKEVDEEEDLQAAQPAGPWDQRLASMSGGSRKPLRESDLVPVQAAATSSNVTTPVPAAVVSEVPAAPAANVGTPVPAAVVSEVRKEREYMWAYKYRPRFLKDFICNRDRVEELQEMVRKQQCSHFIFEGPPGVGKRTMALAFLRDALGPQKLKTKNELRKIELKGEHITSIDVNVRTSSQHVEINLSELRGYERHVIVSLINESRASSDKTMQCDHSNCQAIVVHEADKLSTDAQHYIRWILEKYRGCNKIFFCCYDASKLQTIKYLCKIVKLQQPSNSEIVEVLEFIAKKEHIELPHHLAEIIANNSKNNLGQAIRSFEASWKSNHSFKEDREILTGWEDDIANIAKSIVKEQSLKQLYIIRGKLKNLIEHNVSPDFIFDTLILELKKLLDDQFQDKIDAMYQEHRIHDSGPSLSRPQKAVLSSLDKQEESGDKSYDQRRNLHYFMRIEEFTAKFMSFYKSFITKSIGVNGCC